MHIIYLFTFNTTNRFTHYKLYKISINSIFAFNDDIATFSNYGQQSIILCPAGKEGEMKD